jgi:hypothetical protein
VCLLQQLEGSNQAIYPVDAWENQDYDFISGSVKPGKRGTVPHSTSGHLLSSIHLPTTVEILPYFLCGSSPNAAARSVRALASPNHDTCC